MGAWLLAVSRDSELTRALGRLLIRDGNGGQLWAVESVEHARRTLEGRGSLPSAILIDELFLSGESLTAVTEELTWYAPVILVARPERQAQAAALVAEGKADFVPRGDYFIPLATALVERTLRLEREVWQQIHQPEDPADERDYHRENGGKIDPFAAQALRTVGAILDNLEIILRERSRLPAGITRRLGRVADLAFDMKEGLRVLAGRATKEAAERVETAPPN